MQRNASHTVTLRAVGPFDLPLSLRAAASFLPPTGPVPLILRVAVDAGADAAVIELRQASASISATSNPLLRTARLREIGSWMIAADLDLRPFYRLAAGHPQLGPITSALVGLKPLRPPTLFEMAVIAITEQQLSLAAAFRIRTRLIERLGRPIDGLWVFPSPAKLAAAALDELRACGLSARKADHLTELAERVACGRIDLEGLRLRSDAEAREILHSVRGLGPWSIDYILVRGLGRPDSLPASDVGLQRVVGEQLSGRRMSADELVRVLEPFRPFRGLAAFYASVYARLSSRG